MNDTTQLALLEAQVKEVDQKVKDVNSELEQILNILVGNVLDKTDSGFIGTVNDHETRLDKLERFKDRIVWTVIGSSIGSIGLWKFIESLINK